MSKLLKKWMQENNLKKGEIYDLYVGYTIEGKEEKINQSEILFGYRIKCRPFHLSYVFVNGLYDLLHTSNDLKRLSEVEFLKQAKMEFQKYNDWYAKNSYTNKKREINKDKPLNNQTSFF